MLPIIGDCFVAVSALCAYRRYLFKISNHYPLWVRGQDFGSDCLGLCLCFTFQYYIQDHIDVSLYMIAIMLLKKHETKMKMKTKKRRVRYFYYLTIMKNPKGKTLSYITRILSVTQTHICIPGLFVIVRSITPFTI